MNRRTYRPYLGLVVTMIFFGSLYASVISNAEGYGRRNRSTDIVMEDLGINEYSDFVVRVSGISVNYSTDEVYVEIMNKGTLQYGGRYFTLANLDLWWYSGMDQEVGYFDDDSDGMVSVDDILYVDLHDEWVDGELRLRNITSDIMISSLSLTVEDDDGDGLPDYWEKLFFSDLDEDADGDPDGDEVTNIDEYTGGTDPSDEYDYPTNTLWGNVTDSETGDPVESTVEVILYNERGEAVYYDFVYYDGSYSINYIKDGTYSIKAVDTSYNQNYYALETEPFRISGGKTTARDLEMIPIDIYIYDIRTSSPEYTAYSFIPGENVKLTIVGTPDKVIDVKVSLNDNVKKTFSGEKLDRGGHLNLTYTISPDAPDGEYNIECYLRGTEYPCGGDHRESFTVRLMEMDMILDRQSYLPGDEVLIYYSVEEIKDGTVVSTISGEWEIFRSVLDEEKYDYVKETVDKGKFTDGVGSISVHLKKNTAVDDYTVWFRANDSKDEHSAVEMKTLSVSNMNLDVDTNSNLFLPGEFITITTTVEVDAGYYYYDSPVEDASVDVIISIYDSKKDKWTLLDDVEKKDIPTNARGLTSCVLQLPEDAEEGDYKVEGTARKYDIEASAHSTFRVQKSARITLLLEFDKDYYVSGESAILDCITIFSKESDESLNYKYLVQDGSTGRIYDSASSTNPTYEFDIPENFVGSLDFRVSAITPDGYEVHSTKSIPVRYGDLEINVNRMEYTSMDYVVVHICISGVPKGDFEAYYQIFDENDDLYIGGSIPLTVMEGTFSFRVPEKPGEEYEITVIVVNDDGFSLTDSVEVNKVSGYELTLSSDPTSHEPESRVKIRWNLRNREGRGIEGARTLHYSVREVRDDNKPLIYEGRITTVETSGEFYITIPGDASDGTEYLINAYSSEKNGYNTAYSTYFLVVDDPHFVETTVSSYYYFFGVTIALILAFIAFVLVLRSRKREKLKNEDEEEEEEDEEDEDEGEEGEDAATKGRDLRTRAMKDGTNVVRPTSGQMTAHGHPQHGHVGIPGNNAMTGGQFGPGGGIPGATTYQTPPKRYPPPRPENAPNSFRPGPPYSGLQ